MCIRHETWEKARRSLSFSPVSKPHTHITYMLRQCTSIVYNMGCLKKMAPTCEKNVQIKLTPKNFMLIIFNVVYIEVNETRKKL